MLNAQEYNTSHTISAEEQLATDPNHLLELCRTRYGDKNIK